MYEDRTSAEVIADSIWDGVRLVSFRATLPTIVQFHLLRHRAFSFSFASMRAIPLKRQIELVRETPFYPQKWPKNQPGMSASENFEDEVEIHDIMTEWEGSLEEVLRSAEGLAKLGVHKEIASRLLLPFSWSTCIISSTMPGLDNFFAQRDHEDAQPEIRTLAKAMRKALDESTPTRAIVHIPFDRGIYSLGGADHPAIVRAVARCARVSYGREMEEKTYEEDANLVARLIKSKHWSPLEHVGVVIPNPNWEDMSPDENIMRYHYTAGNFESPFSQLRHHWRDFLPSIAARVNVK